PTLHVQDHVYSAAIGASGRYFLFLHGKMETLPRPTSSSSVLQGFVDDYPGRVHFAIRQSKTILARSCKVGKGDQNSVTKWKRTAYRKSLFQRDAETNTRDACATRNRPAQKTVHNLTLRGLRFGLRKMRPSPTSGIVRMKSINDMDQG